jgi:hypothetical protein
MEKPFCPTCKEDLQEIESDFMKKNGLTECVKCRAKKEKPIVIAKPKR